MNFTTTKCQKCYIKENDDDDDDNDPLSILTNGPNINDDPHL